MPDPENGDLLVTEEDELYVVENERARLVPNAPALSTIDPQLERMRRIDSERLRDIGIGGPIRIPKKLVVRAPPLPQKYTDFGGRHRMQTDASLTENGHLSALTHIWTGNDWEGYHGVVIVAFLDSSGQPVEWSDPRTYGVEGNNLSRASGTPSERFEPWRQDFDPSRLAELEVTQMAVIQAKAPIGLRESISRFLKNLRKVIKDIKDTKKDIDDLRDEFGGDMEVSYSSRADIFQ